MSGDTNSKVSYENVAADSGYLSDLVDTARKNDEAADAMLWSSTSGRGIELILSTFDDTEWDDSRTGARLTKINKECNDVVLQIKPSTKFPIIPLEITLARVRAELEPLQDQKRRVNPVVAEKSSPILQPRLSVRVADPAHARSGSKQQIERIDPAQIKKKQVHENVQPNGLTVVSRAEDTPEAFSKERSSSIGPDRAHKKQEQTKVQTKEPAVVDSYGRTRAAYKKIREMTQMENVNKQSYKRKSDGADESLGQEKFRKLNRTG